jgi:multicomponent Na+:H+ antiporter subunit C
MDLILPIITGILYTAGMYLMLRRSFVKLIIGMVILGHASNLFLFVISRITRGAPALVKEGVTAPQTLIADPLPQALILTAIVISFGIQAFAIILLKRLFLQTGTSDLDRLDVTDKIEEK